METVSGSSRGFLLRKNARMVLELGMSVMDHWSSSSGWLSHWGSLMCR